MGEEDERDEEGEVDNQEKKQTLKTKI